MGTCQALLLACAAAALRLAAAGAAPPGVDIAWVGQRGYGKTIFELNSQIQQSSNLIANATFGTTTLRPLLDSGSGIINTNGVGCFDNCALDPDVLGRVRLFDYPASPTWKASTSSARACKLWREANPYHDCSKAGVGAR